MDIVGLVGGNWGGVAGVVSPSTVGEVALSLSGAATTLTVGGSQVALTVGGSSVSITLEPVP